MRYEDCRHLKCVQTVAIWTDKTWMAVMLLAVGTCMTGNLSRKYIKL